MKKTTGRMGRPSAAQTREKMDDLLQAARREFVRNGYRATTMDAIAAAAEVSKRTLYLWHKDKAAVFLACVVEGTRRFPPLAIDAEQDVERALEGYATALAGELASEFSYGMGLLITRETRDFPELAAASQEVYARYIFDPLAAYLRRHGLERPASTTRTQLLLAMALAEVQGAILMGAPSVDAAAAEQRARDAVEVFLRGGRIEAPAAAGATAQA